MKGQTLDAWDRKPWKSSKYHGRLILQTPVDLQLFSELIDDIRPSLIVECGVLEGGFSLWLNFAAAAAEIRCKILCVDRVIPSDVFFPSSKTTRLGYIIGNTTSPKSVELIKSAIEVIDIPGQFESVSINKTAPRLFILDDDHDPNHVFDELQLYSELCRSGDWIVVCDTVPVSGLEEAVRTWARENGFESVHVDRFGLSNHRGGWLRKRGAKS